MKKSFIIGLLSFLPVLAMAASPAEEARQIQTKLDQCLEKADGVTTAVTECHGLAFREADALLNKVYGAIVKRLEGHDELNGQEKLERLKAAQRAWITFRDTNSKLHGSYSIGGTIEPALIASKKVSMTIERIIELVEPLNSLQD